MKICICDICKSEGKTVESGYYLRLKKDFQTLRVDVCAGHRGVIKSYDQAIKILIASNNALNSEAVASTKGS